MDGELAFGLEYYRGVDGKTCWRCGQSTSSGTTMAAGWIGGGTPGSCDASID